MIHINNKIVGIGIINALFEVRCVTATDQEICMELTLININIKLLGGKKKTFKKESTVDTEKEMVNSELPSSPGTRYKVQWGSECSCS